MSDLTDYTSTICKQLSDIVLNIHLICFVRDTRQHELAKVIQENKLHYLLICILYVVFILTIIV